MDAQIDLMPLPSEGMTEVEIVQTTRAYLDESVEAKRERKRLSERNRNAYDGMQDWSHKVEGQSREFLPKTSETADQFAAFIKRGLVQFGDWFSMELPDGAVISDNSARDLLMCYLNRLRANNEELDFSTLLSDGTKVALLESVMIFKVRGEFVPETVFHVEEGENVISMDMDTWRLAIDLIRPEDYDIDPTGRGLYKIHTIEKDLHVVKQLAEKGIYEKSVVDLIVADSDRSQEEKRDTPEEEAAERAQPAFRKRIQLRECWGTILDNEGNVVHENVVWTVANDRWLIRKPQKFPFWHGQDPFEKIPLVRKPFTEWHKALYDEVVPLNLAINELFNLILDGGIASVWGIKELRADMLVDPRQVANGIPQGKTLLVREDAPSDGQALKQVTEGQVPADALAVFNLLDKELHASARTSDIKMGLLPAKQVKATEVVESQQSQAVMLDTIVADIERALERLLKKSWMVLMQFTGDIAVKDLKGVLRSDEVVRVAQMSTAERFANMTSGCSFKVHGLSATLARARDFQRLMAVLQVAQTNPVLLPAVLRRWSPDKLLDYITRTLNINPNHLERDREDEANSGNDASLITQVLGQQQSGVQGQGEPGMQSDINQAMRPTDGL